MVTRGGVCGCEQGTALRDASYSGNELGTLSAYAVHHLTAFFFLLFLQIPKKEISVGT
jgi:hypothetical protein